MNGEKFEFSREVLESGEKLVESFFNLLNNFRLYYVKLVQNSCETNVGSLESSIKVELKEFDIIWAQFERGYVLELMEIEVQARRLIFEAIEIEK